MLKLLWTVIVPISFVYSRVIWMAVDNAIDPFSAWEEARSA